MTDTGRADVYAAERAAFEGTAYEAITDFAELAALAALVTGAPWWPHGPIEVRPARSDARSSVTRQRGSDAPVVRLAAPQMTPATVVHELAHVLAGIDHGHDARFRRAHVDLAGLAFGPTEAGWLLDAYAGVGLGPGDRAWPAPPVRRVGGTPLAL